jgi:hypothetical protein
MALLIVSIIAGCRTVSTPLPDEVAACEAVFLPWWNHLDEKERKDIHAVYFPDTNAQAAVPNTKAAVTFPPSFFEKYRGSVPPVLGESQLKGERVENRDLFWGFTDLRSVDPDTYEVHAGYFCGSLCGRYCDYRIGRQKDGSWKIVAASNCMVF